VKFTYDEQYELLHDGTAATEKLLNVKIDSFIPPFNAFNNDTLNAAKALNFNYFSSQTNIDVGPWPLENQTFYRFPVGASTSTFGSGIPVTADVTWAQIQQQLAANGFSGVMIHPQDFSESINGTLVNVVNQTQLAQLRTLLQKVAAQQDLRTVVLNRVNTDAPEYMPIAISTGNRAVITTTGTASTSWSCNCVAFRLDTVQDYYLVDAQMQVMSIFAEYLAPLTLGIVTGSFGHDATLIDAISKTMTIAPLDVGFNGDTYVDFTSLLTYANQLSQFTKGLINFLK
jgi:hypothetical protein